MKFGKALMITATMFLAVSAHASSSQGETTAESEKKVQVIEFDDAEAAYIIVVTREGKSAEEPAADRAPASIPTQVVFNK